MSRTLTGFRVLIGGLVVLAAWLASSSTGWAEEIPAIQTGDYAGVWTGYKTAFSVQEVHDNDTFDGVAEHQDGPFKGIKFGFHGKIAKDGSLVVTRYVAGDKQVAKAGPPKVADGQAVWSAETKGVGIPEEGSWPFSLTIPVKE